MRWASTLGWILGPGALLTWLGVWPELAIVLSYIVNDLRTGTWSQIVEGIRDRRQLRLIERAHGQGRTPAWVIATDVAHRMDEEHGLCWWVSFVFIGHPFEELRGVKGSMRVPEAAAKLLQQMVEQRKPFVIRAKLAN